MATWIKTAMEFQRGEVTLLYPEGLAGGLEEYAAVVNAADLSTVSADPAAANMRGLIRPGDVLVFTQDALYWLDMTCDRLRTTNGGGGLLRGCWPLKAGEGGALGFAVSIDGYAPNLFAAGAKPGQQGSGISLLGNYGQSNVDNGFGLAIEHETSPELTEQTGMAFSQDGKEGVTVQISGLLANSSGAEEELAAHGLDSRYDVDTRPGLEGRVAYTLTYRFSLQGLAWQQDINLTVTQNQCGALATLVISNNVAGYDGQELFYAGAPLLAGKDAADNAKEGSLSLGKEACQLYRHPWRETSGSICWVEPPSGTGKAAGIGPADGKAPMLTVRLNKETLPPRVRSTYRIMTIDNQGISSDRYNCLDIAYFNVNNGHAPVILNEGESIHLALDYAFVTPEG